MTLFSVIVSLNPLEFLIVNFIVPKPWAVAIPLIHFIPMLEALRRGAINSARIVQM